MDMPLSINNSEFEASTSSSENSCLIKIEENEAIIPIEDLDPLSVVLNYHFKGEGQVRVTREIAKQSGLFVVSILGVIFYYVPAKAYAEAICADPSYKDIPCDFFVFNHLTGTLLVAGTILMNATNAYLDQQNAAHIPLKLVNYLEYSLTTGQKTAKDVMTLAGSLIASMPFPILSMVNSTDLPIVVDILQALTIWMTNTFLHLLPVHLAFENFWYGLPFRPIQIFVQQLSNALLSAEEKQEKELQEQIDQHCQMIKQRLINHLDLAQRLLSIHGFRFTGCDYSNKVKNHIHGIKDPTQSPLQLLTQLFDRLHKMSPDRAIAPSGRINNFFRKAVYLPGASWVILACAGFWGGTFNEMKNLTGNPVSAAVVSAPSIYCFGVLLAFFGGNALQSSYDYLTAWKDDSVKIPMAFKLYPKTSVLLIMISMYLSAFSYAAGAQLINDNFNGKLEFLRPYLLDLAKTGLTFLGFTAMIDFFNNVLSKFAQYGGAEDAQTVIQLFAALSQMKNSVQLMKPDLLMSSLSTMDVERLKTIFNVREEKDREELNYALSELKIILNGKFFKESALYEKGNDAESELVKKLNQLKDSLDLPSHKIEALLTDFDTELPPSLKEVCKYYVAVCKVLTNLEKINLVNDREFENLARNDNSYAGTSTATEITPLLRRASGGPSRFFHPRHQYNDGEPSLSPAPVCSNSNHYGV